MNRQIAKSSPENSLALSVTFGDSSPKGRALGSPRGLHLFAKSSPFGGAGERSEPERVRPPQRRAFAESGAAAAVCRCDPSPVKMRLERSAERDKREIINNFSAKNAQSATTTTAASGGSREELLGQRPARRKCRPRHEADAGCRNPIAAGILNRLTVRFVWTSP